jgi:hypothetical protein
MILQVGIRLASGVVRLWVASLRAGEAVVAPRLGLHFFTHRRDRLMAPKAPLRWERLATGLDGWLKIYRRRAKNLGKLGARPAVSICRTDNSRRGSNEHQRRP